MCGAGRPIRAKEALYHEELLADQTTPAHPCFVRFENGAEFLGYTMEADSIRPGQSVKVRYFWRLARAPAPDTAVFVHVRGPKGMFRGDHSFLGLCKYVEQVVGDEIIREDEVLRVPSDAPAELYQMRLGLFNTETGRRLKVVQTSLPVTRNAVSIDTLQVQ